MDRPASIVRSGKTLMYTDYGTKKYIDNLLSRYKQMNLKASKIKGPSNLWYLYTETTY